jgi:23S rRNA (uracil1939-C5)-methyltransferase
MILDNLEITDIGDEGKGIARSGNMVVFIRNAIPGDVVDAMIIRKKKSFLEGIISRIHKNSPLRIEPFCDHFGTCGGCRWQHMTYESQLHFKQKHVEDCLTRIGRIQIPGIRPILPSPFTTGYRNKLEFTFSSRKWKAPDETGKQQSSIKDIAVGFHPPGIFDKVLDISTCHLMTEPSNRIRNYIREYIREHNLTCYDIRRQEGFMRTMIVRNTTTGNWMVVVVFRDHEPDKIFLLLEMITREFPEITSLFYVTHQKSNDDISDQVFHLFSGEPFITESFPGLRAGDPEIYFRIGPASFFQTNSHQALRLYKSVIDLAGFQGNEVVYDLYSGIGSIAISIARLVRRVIGIESIPSAVEDARINSMLNMINNIDFYHGEAEKLLTLEFIAQQGKCDVVITDPPRAGMHETVVKALLQMNPGKIIYISCNPATQARDIAMLVPKYHVSAIQPIDMFPHTTHVENMALLEKG